MTNSCFTVLLITRYLQLIPVFAAIGFSAGMERDKSLTQNLGKRNKSENSSKWVGYTLCSYVGGCCVFGDKSKINKQCCFALKNGLYLLD